MKILSVKTDGAKPLTASDILNDGGLARKIHDLAGTFAFRHPLSAEARMTALARLVASIAEKEKAEPAKVVELLAGISGNGPSGTKPFFDRTSLTTRLVKMLGKQPSEFFKAHEAGTPQPEGAKSTAKKKASPTSAIPASGKSPFADYTKTLNPQKYGAEIRILEDLAYGPRIAGLTDKFFTPGYTKPEQKAREIASFIAKIAGPGRIDPVLDALESFVESTLYAAYAESRKLPSLKSEALAKIIELTAKAGTDLAGVEEDARSTLKTASALRAAFLKE